MNSLGKGWDAGNRQVGTSLVFLGYWWGEDQQRQPECTTQGLDQGEVAAGRSFPPGAVLCEYLYFITLFWSPALTVCVNCRSGRIWVVLKPQKADGLSWGGSNGIKALSSDAGLHAGLHWNTDAGLRDFRTLGMGYYKHITSDHKIYLFYFMWVPKIPKTHIKQLFISLRNI